MADSDKDIQIFARPNDAPQVHIVVAEVGDKKVSLRAFYDERAAHAFKLLAARSIRDAAAHIHELDTRRDAPGFLQLVAEAAPRFDWGLPLETMAQLLGYAGIRAACGVYTLPFDGREMGAKQYRRILSAYGPPELAPTPVEPAAKSATAASKTKFKGPSSLRDWMREPF